MCKHFYIEYLLHYAINVDCEILPWPKFTLAKMSNIARIGKNITNKPESKFLATPLHEILGIISKNSLIIAMTMSQTLRIVYILL